MTNATARERNKAAVQRLFARGRSSPAPWTCPPVRCADGTLLPDMRLSKQWQLAQEVGCGHGDAAAAAAVSAPHICAAGPGSSSCSCYIMNRKIARHEWETNTKEKRRLQGGSPRSHEREKEQRAAMDREQAILRYELSIPRRRVVDHLLHLTASQLDLCHTMPTAHTMDRLVEQKRGRWVLQNPYRQLLLRGEPVMTRIMRGEFYATQRNETKATNFPQANKRHVRIASNINHAMHFNRGKRGSVDRVQQSAEKSALT
ncbi:hypothetical protein TcYC6_0108300 [Trypanosoma cruzi]|uniref:Uncharacterized protein n=1 Tax=Trypanosoma cruzi TaxID=5693 RepID=A0A7J6Y427_TRYCR|nr:hypothetical protein ECC02_005514 [Trypanosoma cruzi]KAF8293191.1 hypothetical protein TcYC6_0108300 [Trypanosoma cruzi]